MTEEEMVEVKTCMSCKNKNCYIVTLPEEKKKDCKEHHENYDFDIVFDCKNIIFPSKKRKKDVKLSELQTYLAEKY